MSGQAKRWADRSSSLTEVKLTEFKPIAVISSRRDGRSTGYDWSKEVGPVVEDNNNEVKQGSDGRQCLMCVENVRLEKEAYYQHRKEHYELLFKCSYCLLGFEEHQQALKHLTKQHPKTKQEDKKVLLPSQPDQLLVAQCRLRGCKRKFVGVGGLGLEEHFLLHHQVVRRKAERLRQSGVEWLCRVCSGGRLKGEKEAIRHVTSHLEMGPGDVSYDSDTTSGGFSSDCSSLASGSSDESSESDRMTDDLSGGRAEDTN